MPVGEVFFHILMNLLKVGGNLDVQQTKKIVAMK